MPPWLLANPQIVVNNLQMFTDFLSHIPLHQQRGVGAAEAKGI
jgi:hypothetical protein